MTDYQMEMDDKKKHASMSSAQKTDGPSHPIVDAWANYQRNDNPIEETAPNDKDFETNDWLSFRPHCLTVNTHKESGKSDALVKMLNDHIAREKNPNHCELFQSTWSRIWESAYR